MDNNEILALQKLSGENQTIIDELTQAAQACNQYGHNWFGSFDEEAGQGYQREQNRIIALLSHILAQPCLELMLQAIIVMIEKEIATRQYQIEQEPEELKGSTQEILDNREVAKAEAQYLVSYLAHRKAPKDQTTNWAALKPGFCYQPSPWADDVTSFCSSELAFLNRYLCFWGTSPS